MSPKRHQRPTSRVIDGLSVSHQCIEGADDGHIAPDPPSAVFVEAPVILFGDTTQASQSQLIIEWEKPQAGRLELPLDAPDSGLGETLRLLQGSRLITDMDSRYFGKTAGRSLDRHEQKRIGDRLQALSEAYGLASRRMCLVAVVEGAGDQPGDIPKTTVVPVGMPGKNDFERVVRSLVAVLAFLPEGHTATAGAFRTHVKRLMHSLETSTFVLLSTQPRRTLNDALTWIKKGMAPPWKLGDLLACEEKEVWDRITRLVTPP